MTANLSKSVSSERTASDEHADLPDGLDESEYPDW